MRKKAFTLVELLVVLSIIVVLLSIMLPAFGKIKGRSESLVCMSNMSQLLTAWHLYAADHDGRVVGASTGRMYPFSNKYVPEQVPECPGWVDLPQSDTHIFFNASTLDHKLKGIKAGKLYPYAESVKIYHCPSDKRYKSPPLNSSGSAMTGVGGYRSYSIAAGVNGVHPSGDIGIVPIMLVSEIRHPSRKFVFVEQASDNSFNMASWVINPVDRNWWSPLGTIMHENSSMLGFADGHVELHRWQNENTFTMDWNNGVEWQEPPAGQDEDLRYMQNAYPYKALQSN